MEKFITVIGFIIVVPFYLLIVWGFGMIFRSSVLKHDCYKGNKYLQAFISIIIGFIGINIILIFLERMGCSPDY